MQGETVQDQTSLTFPSAEFPYATARESARIQKVTILEVTAFLTLLSYL